MKLDKETNEEIRELQILEQNMQNFLMQKQAFQLESNEIESALEEVNKAKTDEIFKITGQVMIKADKETVKKELEDKKHIINLRLSSIEKQENSIREKVDKLREKVSKKISHK